MDDSLSQVAKLKKNIADLNARVNSLVSLNSKLEKKNQNLAADSKKTKLQNEEMKNEITILNKTIQKLTGEKAQLSTQLADSKKYVSRIEKKLLSNASNKFVIDANEKFKRENETLLKTISELQTINSELNQKVQILNKTVRLKYNSEIPIETLLKNIMCEDHISTIEKMKSEANTLRTHQQEIQYANETLTQMLAEKENVISNLTVSNESFEKHIRELNNEIQTLRKCIEVQNSNQTQIQNDVQTESKLYQDQIRELKNSLLDLNESLTRMKSENEILNKTIDELNKKNSSIDLSLKQKCEKLAEQNSTIASLSEKSSNDSKRIEELSIENEILSKRFNEVNEKVHTLEKENIDLMTHAKEIEVNEDNIRGELIKQNMVLSQSEAKMKHTIEKLNEEIDKLKEEKEKYKNMANTSIIDNKRKKIFEKDVKEREEEEKAKTMSNISNNALAAPQESETLSKLRKEREINKSVMSEIRKLKSYLSAV